MTTSIFSEVYLIISYSFIQSYRLCITTIGFNKENPNDEDKSGSNNSVFINVHCFVEHNMYNLQLTKILFLIIKNY